MTGLPHGSRLAHLAANWIWKESTIAAVLDLIKDQELVLNLEKIRVGARS